ncbi:MAG: cupin [Pseudomonadales bacterium]|nr:cupin [Pseudomonadales bacterium]
MTRSPHSLDKEFVVVSPEKHATIERFDSTLYERLDRDYNGFKGHDLISCHEFDQDWSAWEIHPNGDETVILLSGKVTFVLQLQEGNESVELDAPGTYLIVPRNVWHTAKTSEKSRILFITPGEDTRNREL